MTITERTNFEVPQLPLPPNTAIAIADLAADDGSKFFVTLGLDEAGVQKLRERSEDPADVDLLRFTSDATRFVGDEYAKWYSKERYVYALRAENGDLAAIVWFGPKECPVAAEGHNWHTFAIRTYPPYRGQRLAKPFAEFACKLHARLLPGHSVWLSTKADNEGALRLYEKLGFVRAGEDAEGHVVMVQF